MWRETRKIGRRTPDGAAVRGVTDSEDIVLTATDVSRVYTVGRRKLQAVRDADLTATSRSSIGIVGESGSGKSTLAKILAGLDRPSAGSVDFNGIDLFRHLGSAHGRHDFRRRVQLIAQDTTSSFDPTRTLRDAIRTPAVRLLDVSVEQADHLVDEMLEQLEIPAALVDRKPGAVSGGQRQRCAIARAMIVSPRLLLCDEIVSALDVSVQGAVLNMLKTYRRTKNAGLVFVSHGIPATAFLCDEIVVMLHGRIVEHAPTEQLLADPQHVYTRHLLDAARGADLRKVS